MRFDPSRLLVDPRDSSRVYLGTSERMPVPYITRLEPSATNPRSYDVGFASYLGAGSVTALAPTLSGDVVAAITHQWPDTSAVSAAQIVVVRIGQ